jgi:hypothetical protein
LGVSDGGVVPKIIRGWDINVWVCSPFSDVWERNGKYLQIVFGSMFVKILLKVAYESFVWGVFHGWPIIFVEIVRGRMYMFISYLGIPMGKGVSSFSKFVCMFIARYIYMGSDFVYGKRMRAILEHMNN